MKSANWIWIAGFLLVASVGFFNQGIIALDDYSEGVARFIPAQHLSFRTNLDTAGIRLPFQSIFLLSLSKLALFLGFISPLAQLRFVLILLGTFVYSIQTYCAVRFFEDSRKKLIALLFSSFYFLLPLIYSRPLIENMSGAFVTLSAFFAFRFYSCRRGLWLALSVFSIAFASLFRFQSGVCVLAICFLLFLTPGKRRWAIFILSGLFSFLLTGLLDLCLTGTFHRSLWAYLDYNIHHSSSYGVTPFYTFILLFVGLSIPPVFFSRYKGFKWVEEYHTLLPVLLYFSVFLLAHSLIPHKEERFIIPILVLFLVLLTPLASFFTLNRRQNWRVITFSIVNCFLLFFTSWSTPQSNVISLVLFLSKETSVKRVINYDHSIVLFPSAFSLRSLELIQLSSDQDLKQFKLSCDEVVAVRQDFLGNQWDHFKVVQVFRPGFLEALLVKLNPRQNARRGAIYLMKDNNCD